MAAPDYLRIGRFRVDCLVPRDHPAPEQARGRLAEVVEGLVPFTLSSVISRAFPEPDQSLWFIRELELSVDLNVSIDTHDLARSFAAQTARTLLSEMSLADAENVVRFESPAQFLAAFLADLADGRAWQSWYYRRFDGLRLLPRSAALRTAICDDVRMGFMALRHLASPLVAKIVGCLTDVDAQWVLDALRNSEAGGTKEIPAEFLDAALHALRSLAVGNGLDARTSVLVFIEATRSSTAGESRGSWLCGGLVALVRFLNDAPQSRSRMLVAIARGAGPSEMDALMPLFQLPDSLRVRIIEEFRETTEPASRADAASTHEQITPFGGAFFLLPLMARLPFNDHAVQMHCISDDDLAVFRWLVLIKCFGRYRAADAARDPVLREITGVADEDSNQELLERWQEHVSPRALYRVLAGLRRYRRANQAIGDDSSIVDDVENTASVRLDPKLGYWISISSASSRLSRPADLPEPLRAAMDRLAEDLKYFALPETFGLSLSHDRALSVVAQGLMKDFAWRLPGFSASGPAFLYENFLNCNARVEAAGERSIVTIDRPPLSLILNVTGIHRQRFDLSWLKGQRFELYPENH